jgi:gamma-glutamylcyclotransferase (GGCT)/AIG2-like uncharacterized protein YtfP
MLPKETVWYFAYGSNMDAKRMKKRVGDYVTRIRAALKNYELVFNVKNEKQAGAGFANIEQKNGQVVEGALYLISFEQLEKLDRYEGVPNHYRRNQYGEQKVDVYLVNDFLLKDVYTYFGCLQMKASDLLPTKAYMQHLLAVNADEEYFVSPNYYQRLLAQPTID